MANKKFYYKNKSKKQQSVENESVADTRYTAEQLALSIESMGISESTCALLLKYQISTASDLVKRCDKDMYKVQGFNKKMLFEVKDALRAHGMALKEEVKKPTKNNAQQSSKNQKQGADDAKADGREHKFGLADRRSDGKNIKQQPKQQRQQKPERLTEPLTIENWRKIMKGGKWGFSDGFKTVIPAMYDEVFCFKEGVASVEIDGKCGYIDGENNITIPLDYDIAMSFSDGLAMVAKGEKCGYINKNNEIIIPFEYDAATPFEDGEAKVKKDGKWATVTKDNKLTWI
ncbi:MAG: WG repeat-containing protein [Bacteroides sp.]|nr:WG repeat-containing protein [Bacillota bacterium]MCM1394136.1 WG repeat-containing protein [[Eubacterium] siraeum]MCM1455186.1 WG repeat-containing protein [Bacteroides sp.]